MTIAHNKAGTDGGGIYVGLQSTLHVKNSLVARNTKGSGFGPDCLEENSGGIVSGGHNLIGTTADCSTVFLGPTHDITNVDPRIAQLADNGGPTKTIALKRHSKAINHAGGDAPKRDQRGVKRKNPDIGAFERR